MVGAIARKRLRTVTKRAAVWFHEAGLHLGIMVLPKHYYVPIPDLHELRRTRSRWARRSAMYGVHVDLDGQVRELHRLVLPFEEEYRGNDAFHSATAGACGPGFGYIEAQALHGVIRGLKPRRVIEIGSGVSTYCMLAASGYNAVEGAPAQITCIEPYPSPWLKGAPVALMRERVEDVDAAVFDELDEGDLLFVDSTHTVRTGGDVVRIVLEILPRLRPGVVVHFHDIYFPYDFQRDADRSIFQWMETALLHAFLIDNARASILFCLSHLHYDRPDVLRRVFPEYTPEADADGLRVERHETQQHFPSSLYLVIGAAEGPWRRAARSSNASPSID